MNSNFNVDYSVFVDESGNSGINFLDSNQPVHVSAGWLVANSCLPEFDLIVKNARSQQRRGELKGQKLFQRTSGQVLASRLIVSLLQSGAFPLYVIAERRFCIAGKIVDVLMDPMHNLRARWLPTSEIAKRKEITNQIFGLTSSVLDEFARMYKEPTRESLEFCIKELGGSCRSCNLPVLADTIEGNLEVIDTVLSAENYEDGTWKHSQWAALNVPMFIHTLRTADRRLDACQGAKASVIYDGNSHYDKAFKEAFDIVSNSDVGEVLFDDGTQWRLGITHIASIIPKVSHEVLGLQAADVLATAIFRLCKDTLQGTRWPDTLKEVGLLLFPDLILNDPPIMGGVYGTDEFKFNLIKPFLVKHYGATGRIFEPHTQARKV